MAEADDPLRQEEYERLRQSMQTEDQAGQAPPAEDKGGSRWRARALMFSVPLLLVAVGAYFWLTSGRFVSTDNAYVKQDIVSVGSEVGGRVIKVAVRENQIVNAGDLLFTIDPEPYQVAVQQANADIASAQVRVQQLRTDYASTGVDISGSREDVQFAREAYNRQKELFRRGFTTKARLEEAEHDLSEAQERLRTAQADAAKAKAALATGSQVPGVNPAIAAAQASRAQAELNLKRTAVHAPVGGRVSQTDRLQLGTQVIASMPMVSIVASDRSWIEANFKETDLEHMRPGQPATITFDAYPDMKLKGHVESLGAGTGSEFSVLPAQNANGNWVKVTQRVPVRIAIDDKPARPLIAGLSADVSVDIRGQSVTASGK